MNVRLRKLLDRSFTGLGLMAIGLMAAAVLIILGPILVRGSGAYCFRATVEHRRMLLEQFDRGAREKIMAEVARAQTARQPAWDLLARQMDDTRQWVAQRVQTLNALVTAGGPAARRISRAVRKVEEDPRPVEQLGILGQLLETLRSEHVLPQEMEGWTAEVARRQEANKDVAEIHAALTELLGPAPGALRPALLRQQYGQTRWDRALVKLDQVLFHSEWDYSSGQGVKKKTSREELYRGTALEPLFTYMREHLDDMLRPRWTFYGGFLTDTSKDAHFFGGIWAETLGTLWLTLGAMLFAVPVGILSAVYLCEYAGDHWLVSLLRTFVGALAGVPSIVFGLFGLAFFLNTLHLTQTKSVLAGSLTLALLILPTVIRASEEAILAVPRAYKEAAMGLGAGKWHVVRTVILPSALPGILTGVVISMGRAAGETAPVIFTAAVSVGLPLSFLNAMTQPTPALPWNIYNLCTEHEAVDEIRHVQYGMVFTLVALVLLLNAVAIGMRARIQRRLKG